MEQIDPVQATRVWQRVRGEQSPADQTLQKLLALEAEAGAAYAYIAKHMGENRLLQALREQNRSFINCLTGICLITTEQRPSIPGPPSIRGNAEGLLRQCWKQRQLVLSLVEGIQATAEFKPVFSLLRTRNIDHCRIILELLGQLARK